ncbi:hypothetical protein LAZ67_5000806, partial [Cordylochernes scorpioides]
MKMSPGERNDKIRSAHLCFKCLRKGHIQSQCREQLECKNCGRNHLEVLCEGNSSNRLTKPGRENLKENAPEPIASLSSQACTGQVLLMTTVALLRGPNASRRVRILLDSGSQFSYIKQSLVWSIGIERKGEITIAKSLFGGNKIGEEKHGKFMLELENLGNKRDVIHIEALDQRKICDAIPPLPKGDWLEKLKIKGIILSQDNFKGQEIDILIGANYLGMILTGKIVQVEADLTAVETKLGWTLMGNSPIIDSNDNVQQTLNLLTTRCDLKDLWDLEVLGIRDPVETCSKETRYQEIKEKFITKIQRQSDQRYSVGLPWKVEKESIPSNLDIAIKRLDISTKKMTSQNKLTEYSQIFRDWLTEGLIERVEENPLERRGYYLPHRPVYKMESKTTPIRPVFDASCLGHNGLSLNQCLEKGPNLLERIPEMMIRFRENKFGVTADIRKAFQMVAIEESERNYLRFLWWEKESDRELIAYRHKRLVFGLNCSPFVLNAVIEYHLQSIRGPLVQWAKILAQSFYMDNCITSLETKQEVQEFQKAAIEIMDRAKMDLREWEYSLEENPEKGTCTKILGVVWNKMEDSLKCELPDNLSLQPKLTKRLVLSMVKWIFDPLGFCAPVFLPPKLLLQRSWGLKLGWDTPLPESMAQEFRTWLDQIKFIELIKIPRYMWNDLIFPTEVHIFCDASQIGYGAVAYLRSETGRENTLTLIWSKVRLAPMKSITIPRLELMAMVLGARLANAIQAALKRKCETTLWSDSTTALSWIKREIEWRVFVRNRVREIQATTNLNDWRFVPSQLNPADLLSRGCPPSQFVQSRWWEGPEWLKKPKEFWPKSEFSINPKEINVEENIMKTNINLNIDYKDWILTRRSDYSLNIRVMSYVLRFLGKLKKQSTETGPLKVSELDLAEKKLFRMIQEKVSIEKSNATKSFKILKNTDGLWCVESKLLHGQVPEEFKTPIILPGDHPFVEQLIWEVHLKNGHVGVQFILSKLREKFWIIRGRKTIKKIISKCIACKRLKEKSLQRPMAALPENRIGLGKPFQITGVDLLGPLHLKEGGKVWVAAFTCAVYRAIHLELVKSLETGVFMMALHRFICRRGRPEKIYSDNGTNFAKLNRIFKRLDWTRIERETSIKRIQWNFIPPSAPWWGGFWERMVRTIKEMLIKMLGHRKLKYVQLQTALCEIESIINNRPLTYVSEDDNDLKPLTPNEFLQNGPESSFPEFENLKPEMLHTRYRELGQLKRELKQRFLKEYLGALIQKSENIDRRQLKVGDVVLIGQENLKRMFWPKGRIVNLIPGKDGIVRVAHVKTSTGTLIRALQRLHPLEIFSNVKTIQMDNSNTEPQSDAFLGNRPNIESRDSRTRYGRSKILWENVKTILPIPTFVHRMKDLGEGRRGARNLHGRGNSQLEPIRTKNKSCESSMPFHNENVSGGERNDKIRSAHLCFKCLRKGHIQSQCREQLECKNCGRNHLEVLCEGNSSNRLAKPGRENLKENAPEPIASLSSQACTGQVLLMTTVALLRGPNASRRVRILLDSGSQFSYIKQSLVWSIGIERKGEITIAKSLFGGNKIGEEKHGKFMLELENLGNKRDVIHIEALDQRKICDAIPPLPKGDWLEKLKIKGIILSQDNFKGQEIDILIGANYLGMILTGKIVQVEADLTAVETKLGWTLMGNSPIIDSNDNVQQTLNLLTTRCDLKDLWDLEVLGIRDPVETCSKETRYQEIKEKFITKIQRQSDQRYSVGLPWKVEKESIPSNLDIAIKRLDISTKKMTSQNKLTEYSQIFRDWLTEGLIERVEENPLERRGYYLPHRPVYKMESKTTPIRPVFDASCLGHNGLSLNQCLEKGPNLLERIPEMMIRFRENKFGVTADIRKAFQMVAIEESERNYLRFLWWEKESDRELIAYRHKRLVFGLNCSPFVLNAVIEYHLQSIRGPLVQWAKILAQSFYMDNCITSLETKQEVQEFQKAAIEIMDRAKMDLREWEYSLEENPEKGTCTKILGVVWNKMEDSLKCELPDNLSLQPKLTKRLVLSMVKRIFDPLGFCAPVFLPPKLLLQRSWGLKLGWDTPLPESMAQEFRTWLDQIKFIELIKIPRYMWNDLIFPTEVHIFCDASQIGYGAVAYLRSETGRENTLTLIWSKVRLAPMKSITIPRLELMAMVLGARLANAIQAALKRKCETTLWSDSTTALSWIKREIEWRVFVRNRVREIQATTNLNDWRFVPSQLNPADLLSRGCPPSQFVQSRWWEGPEWLKKPKEFWPKSEFSINPKEINVEENIMKTNINLNIDYKDWILTRRSDYSLNIRVMSYVLRFLGKLKKQSTETGPLKVSELDLAEKKLFRMIQEKVSIEKSNATKSFKILKNTDGLWCVESKLLHGQVPEEFKTPIILPGDHPFVEQLIWEVHLKNGHVGVQFILSKLREKFWIIRGRKTIKKIISKCIACKRLKEKSLQRPMAALPENRIGLGKPFQITGVDLLGPLHLKEGGKVWVAAFTCAVYRAIHLELVKSLETGVFMMALHRFICRRGRPEKIYSDNGTNFAKLNRIFKRLDWTRIERETSIKRIQWIFIPPSAPWWGGFWERMVRTIKEMLIKMLGHRKLKYVQLQTALCEIESIINNRPLTYVSEDDNDLKPLTPNEFLQNGPESSFPEFENLKPEMLHTRYRELGQLKRELKQRFLKEYLGALIQKSENIDRRQLKVGDVVLIGQENLKRMFWPKGRIVNLIPGKDGIVRVAHVKTSTGTLIRALQRLHPLEIFSNVKTIQMDNSNTEPQSDAFLGNRPNIESRDSRTRYGRSKILWENVKTILPIPTFVHRMKDLGEGRRGARNLHGRGNSQLEPIRTKVGRCPGRQSQVDVWNLFGCFASPGTGAMWRHLFFFFFLVGSSGPGGADAPEKYPTSSVLWTERRLR